MSISGNFSAAHRQLVFTADNFANSLTISRDTAGTLLGNNGAVHISGGASTVLNTDVIQAFGHAGNDTVTLNEANGPLPGAQLFGEQGNDMLTGGSGNDVLSGDQGNDALFGSAGNDTLLGGNGDDVLTGGSGSDHVFGGNGNDRMIWNPGDGSDLFEGGNGVDTAEVNGGAAAENFTVIANGARVDFERVSPGPFSIDIGSTEKLSVNMGAGDDTFSASGDLAKLISISVNGGDGNDTIHGSNGNDTLLGGAGNDSLFGAEGNDFVDGNAGADIASLGAGNDVFLWDPGDGSDKVDGGAGLDQLVFDGSAGAENFTLTAEAGGALFTRDLGNISMDLTSVEKVTLNALGGADNIHVNNPSGSGVTEFDVNLGVNGIGDGSADTIFINDDDHNVQVTNNGHGDLTIQGVSGATVHITGFEATLDHLVINGDAFHF